MEVDDDGRWNTVDNTTGILGHVSQITRENLYIYVAQLRHHKENTDLYSYQVLMPYLMIS